MKSLVLASIFLIISSLCMSQKCKFDKNEEIDDLSGLPVLEQKGTIFSGISPTSVWFYYCTNRCWIHFNVLISWGSELHEEVEFHTKTPIIFFFTDSTSFPLFPSIEYSSLSQTVNPTYSISKEEVEMIASKPLEKIRISYSPKNYGDVIEDSSKIIVKYKEVSIRGGRLEDIQNMSTCILGVDFLDSASCSEAGERINLKINPPKSNDEITLESIRKGAKINEVQYHNVDESQIGDIVKYKTIYGEYVYGIVTEKVGKNKVKIKSFPHPGTEFFIEEKIKQIVKIEIIE
ncbi:MAG: hypothetical protein R2764_08510 [Bacteroidales bacterium]